MEIKVAIWHHMAFPHALTVTLTVMSTVISNIRSSMALELLRQLAADFPTSLDDVKLQQLPTSDRRGQSVCPMNGTLISIGAQPTPHHSVHNSCFLVGSAALQYSCPNIPN